MNNPRLFISYSWTSPEHEDWVLKLATELRESGVDVILDKWDLKEGHDAYVFMEQMVTDPSVSKVIIVCEPSYVRKADSRAGGVGTETQIISGEIYARSDQSKFVAVVREHSTDGSSSVPAYYKSRIHIDLSDPSCYAESFDQLLRWVFNRPLNVKPQIGPIPEFLRDSKPMPDMATTTRQRRAVEAMRAGRETADGAISDYLEHFSASLEGFRIKDTGGEFDDAVVANIEDFLPFRNEMIDFLEALSNYRDTTSSRESLQRFFESLLPYLYGKPDANSWSEWDFDNYRFIVHELLLYCVSIFLKRRRFETVRHLLESEYFLPGSALRGENSMVDYSAFHDRIESLKARNERLKLRRLSLRADLLEKRCRGVCVEFTSLMQTDFVLYIRSCLNGGNMNWRWWPETLVFHRRIPGPFEIFARAKSKKVFHELCQVLGISGKDELAMYVEEIEKSPHKRPQWDYDTFSPVSLMGYKMLCTER